MDSKPVSPDLANIERVSTTDRTLHHEVVRNGNHPLKVIKKSQVAEPRENKMSETFDEKLEQFEQRLWDGVTPKGISHASP